jgi:hypothetical protein
MSSQHRRGGAHLLRPVVFVPAVLVLLLASAGVVYAVRDPGETAEVAATTTAPPVTPSTVASALPPPSQAVSPSASSAPPPPSSRPTPSTSAPAPKKPACGGSKAACGYPHAGNTGPRKTPTVRKSGNISIRDNGAVLKGWNLKGSLDIYANNVTVTDCSITSSNWWAVNLRPGFTGLKVTHCRITDTPGKGPDNGGSNYAVSNMSEGSIEVGYNNISGFGNVLSMGHGTIHDNYVHSISTFVTDDGEWQHTDSVISNGSDNGGLVIRHNTLLNDSPIDKGSTAAVGLFADNGPVRNTTVEDNWLAGGAYVLYGGAAGSSNIRITGNVFSTEFHPKGGIYGFATAWNAGGPGNVWSGNRTSEGAAVPPPSAG